MVARSDRELTEKVVEMNPRVLFADDSAVLRKILARTSHPIEFAHEEPRCVLAAEPIDVADYSVSPFETESSLAKLKKYVTA